MMRLRSKSIFILILAAVSALALGACGGAASSDETSFRLNKDGSVEQVIVGTNDGTISKEDLENYINSQVSAYVSGSEEPGVEFAGCDVNEQSIRIEMEYASISDYAAFNKVTAFAGDMKAALAEGFDFGTGVVSENGLTFSGYTLTVEYPEMEVLVLQEPMKVIIPEDAVLVSDNIIRNDDGSLKIAESEAGGIPDIFKTVNMEPSYIIFKAPEK